MKRRKRDADWWTTRGRDLVLFAFGLAGIAYEALVEQIDRPVLLAIFGGFCGLPVFLNRDEKGPPDEDDHPKP